jgi:hypothetical protein
VIATIALFAALGGGYATAFSGSGTLQKGGKFNLTTSYQSIRTLTGIGDLQARCQLGPERTELRIVNPSGKLLEVRSFRESDGVDAFNELLAGPTTDSTWQATSPGGTTIRFHIYSVGSSAKRPQADIVVSAFKPNDGDCTAPQTDAGAVALVLNTEE